MPRLHFVVYAGPMAAPAWFWPPSGQTARSVALMPRPSGLMLLDWTTPKLWPFTGTQILPAVARPGPIGFSSAAPDGSGGLWAPTFDGTYFWYSPPMGSPVLPSLPSGQVYVGCAMAMGSGFALAASGTVYKWDASTPTSFGAFQSSGTLMTGSGATLYAYLPPTSGIGVMTVPGAATGSVVLPSSMTTVSCLAIGSGLPLVAGGWKTAPPLSGVAAAVLDPEDATVMVAVGSGFALQWQAPAALADAWTQTQALTGLIDLTAAAWRPDGSQVLTASVSSGMVQVLGYASGALVLSQNLAVSAACSIAVAADSIHALLAQSGQSQATPIAFAAGSWSTGVAVTGMPGIVAVASYGATGAVAAFTSGLAFLGLTGSSWSITSSAALAFPPTSLAVDPFLQVYVAGSGILNVFSGTTAVGSGTWAGAAPTSLVEHQGRVVMAVPSDGLYRVFGLSSPGSWTEQSTTALSLGAAVGLALSQTTLFGMGSGGTDTYGFSGTPYVLTPVLSGSVAQWAGSWTETPLGVGHLPSALGFDASGNVWTATKQNTLWSVSSGGSVLSSGTVPQYSTQPQTVPLGPSALIVSSGNVYVATSMPGVLVEAA